MEIRDVDRIEVDQPDRADPRRRQVHRRRGAESASADAQHAGGFQAPLTSDADLAEGQMAADTG